MASLTWQRAYRGITKIFALFGVLVFCGIVAFVIVTSWKTPIHQFNLWKLEKNFRVLVPSHPMDSTSVLAFTKFGGLFSSTAYSCDYFVGEFRTSTSSKEDIQGYYRALSVAMPHSAERLPIQVRFADEREFWIYYPWSELYGELLRLLQRFPSEQDGMYVVLASQTVHPPYADFRCW